MPLYETFCASEDCSRYGVVEEHYFPSFSSEMPICQCGNMERKAISRFGAIWTKGISDYCDPSKEYYDKRKSEGGHWVTRTRSSRNADGSPEREFITSVQQQRAYCRDEGLIPPDEVGTFSVGKDGQTINSGGLPGSWV